MGPSRASVAAKRVLQTHRHDEQLIAGLPDHARTAGVGEFRRPAGDRQRFERIDVAAGGKGSRIANLADDRELVAAGLFHGNGDLRHRPLVLRLKPGGDHPLDARSAAARPH